MGLLLHNPCVRAMHAGCLAPAHDVSRAAHADAVTPTSCTRRRRRGPPSVGATMSPLAASLALRRAARSAQPRAQQNERGDQHHQYRFPKRHAKHGAAIIAPGEPVMSNSSTVVVGLGSNLGPSQHTLRSAARELRRLALPEGPFRVSALYESEAFGPPQPKYLNAAVLLRTGLGPLALLDAIHAVELAHGRVRTERWGARTLDLDLLWREEGEVTHPRLRIPHPELAHRLFALLPLLDVAPSAETPEGAPWRAAADQLDPSGIVRIAGPEWVGCSTTLEPF